MNFDEIRVRSAQIGHRDIEMKKYYAVELNSIDAEIRELTAGHNAALAGLHDRKAKLIRDAQPHYEALTEELRLLVRDWEVFRSAGDIHGG